jgi:hypothetical protein
VSGPRPVDYASPQASAAFLVRKDAPWFQRIPQAAETAVVGLTHPEAVRDPDLATLDQMLRMTGSAVIATLGTTGAKTAGVAYGEFLGFASFFTAMAAWPRLLNWLVKTQKRVDLGQKYQDQHGVVRPLYEDNQFRLDLLPEEEIERLAHRFHIPEGPSQHRLTLDKINQLAVQNRTWWMLTAGPATVALSGLACHMLEAPIQAAGNALRMAWHQHCNASAKNSFQFTHHLSRLIEQTIGKRPDAHLSRWWDRFGENILRDAGLDRQISPQEVLSLRIRLSDGLLRGVANLVEPSEKYKVERTLRRLSREKDTLNFHRTRLLKLLETRQPILQELLKQDLPALPPEQLKREVIDPMMYRLGMQINGAFAGAITTVVRLQHLFDQVQRCAHLGMSPEAAQPMLRPLIEEASKTGAHQALEDGSYNMGRILSAGKFRMFHMAQLQASERMVLAAQWAGASPLQCLERGLRHMAQAGLYRKFVFSTLGVLGLGTALFQLLILGRVAPRSEASPVAEMSSLPRFRRQGGV